MTQNQKKWIDGASYEQLMRRWRFAVPDDPMFIASTEVFGYYKKNMSEKRRKIGEHEHARISKKIGWDP